MSDAAPHLPPFTRRRLCDLLDCSRRYWLRNVARRPWPADPLPPSAEESVLRGTRFHQLMQRHFLGLELGPISPDLQDWWQAWLDHPLALPPGRRLPELTLSVPLAGQRLLARFDLLALSPDGSALIVDWKTARRPPSRAELAADLQTQLYPFVLAQGGQALLPAFSPPLRPEQIEMVYWLAQAPAAPLRFPYSTGQHDADRAFFQHLIHLAQRLDPSREPPPTEDLSRCAPCAFRNYCQRLVTPSPDPGWMDDLDELDDLEPRA